MSINLSLPLNNLGYGISGLNILNAFEENDHCPALWPIGPIDVPQQYHKTINLALTRAKLYNQTAPSLRIWHQFDLAQHVGKGLQCALPIFELDKFNTTEIHHLNNQDILFVASSWAKQIVEDNGIKVKTCVTPFGVDTNIFQESAVNKDGPTVFLNVGKWEMRKGHDILVDAFAKAFEPGDNVRLVMHCLNPCIRDPDKAKTYNQQWARLYQSKLGDRVKIFNQRFATQNELAKLMSMADCGVFPARAEGWNMELAEMMAMGKQVIATNYSGHTEYCTHDNSLLIEVNDFEEAYDGLFFTSGIGRWASLGDSQVDQLVDHMRAVHKSKQEGNLKINQSGIDTFRKLSWNECVKKIVEVPV